MANPTPPRWTIADALDTYGIRNWGAGYFGINDKGNVIVHPDGPDHRRSISKSWSTRCAAAASASRC